MRLNKIVLILITMIFSNLLLVFLGGGLGSLSRYLVYLGFPSQGFFQALIPNLLGCFFIGLASHSYVDENEALKLLFVLGFLGGFTTFSSYVAFIGQSGFYTPTALSYFALNNVLGVLFYIIGSKLV